MGENQGFGPFSLVLATGAIEGLILSTILLTKKGRNQKANRYLAALLGILAATIVLHLFGHMNRRAVRFHKSAITMLNTWNAPIIFYYARTLRGIDGRSANWRAATVATAVSAGLFFASSLLLSAAGRAVAESLAAFAFLAATIAYLGAALGELRSRADDAGQDHREPPSRRWLSHLISALLIFWMSVFAADALLGIRTWDIPLSAGSLLILFIGNYGFFMPSLFWNKADAPKYKKSGLPRWMAIRIRDKLATLMEKEKLYTDPELDLGALSKKVGVGVHHLSRVINEQMGTTFYDYVNKLRIEESRKLLSDPKERGSSIADISLRAGFNTLSTFNTSFNRFIGTTPSKFRREADRKNARG
jgi:AraC-like DNA-binding protein